MAKPQADLSDLVGVPFAYGGRGPDAYDCYGLVMECARRNGLDLPDFGFADNQALISAMMGATMPQWEQVDQAVGTVVLMRAGRFVSHVGYVIGPNQMIHTWETAGGVCIERLSDWKQRIIGFFKYVGTR